jgi:hypothetical protein
MKKQTTDDMRKDPTTTAPDLTAYAPEELFLPQREPESDFDEESLEQLELRETNLSEWEIREIEMRRELGLPDYEPREAELKDSDLDGTDKGIVLRVIACGYLTFLVGYCTPRETHKAWSDFNNITGHYSEFELDAIIKSACDAFSKQDPEPLETSLGYDAMTSRALREQYVLHYWLRRCECPTGSPHVMDPSWVDEEAGLHRQGQCRFEGPKIPWPWPTAPAEEK